MKVNDISLWKITLSCLQKGIQENELCVLFRNNHYNTMIKHSGSLYLLMSHEDYIADIDLIWQRLDKANGAGPFFTSNFVERNEAWIEQLALTEDSSAQIDSSVSEKFPAFDAAVVNGCIVNHDWVKLDEYIGKLLELTLHMIPHEVHPGLFMILRKERLLDLMSEQKFEEAAAFYQNSIESLRGPSQGRFASFNLVREIDELRSMLEDQSLPEKRDTLEYIETMIVCYMHLYFSSCQDNGEARDLWQFVMKLPVPERETSKKYGLVCLACLWESEGSHAISVIRSHILQNTKVCKGCPQVSQDMLDRLKSADPKVVVPSLEDIKNRFDGKRRSESVSKVSPAAAQAAKRLTYFGSASMVSAAGRAPKKPRSSPKGCPQLTSKKADLEAKKKRVKEISDALKRHADDIMKKVESSVLPEYKYDFVMIAFKMQDLVLQLTSLEIQLGVVASEL